MTRPTDAEIARVLRNIVYRGYDQLAVLALADALDALPTVTWEERIGGVTRAIDRSWPQWAHSDAGRVLDDVDAALRAGFPELAPDDA